MPLIWGIPAAFPEAIKLVEVKTNSEPSDLKSREFVRKSMRLPFTFTVSFLKVGFMAPFNIFMSSSGGCGVFIVVVVV